MNATQKMQVVDLPLDRIDANPGQPRRKFDQPKLEELAASIRDKGVLEPILVRSQGEGSDSRYILIAGERRVRACRMGERETIPAIVLDVGQDEGVEMAILENIQREDLGPVEEATALSALLDRCGNDAEQVAIRVRKSVAYVKSRLGLLNLHEQVQRMLDRGEINLAQATVLLDIPDVAEQITAAHLAHDLQLNANQLKGRTQHLKKKEKEKEKDGPDRKPVKVTFTQLSAALIKLFDLVDGSDWGEFPLDQRETLVQQVDALIALLQGRQRELGVATAGGQASATPQP